jgi:hypothetical protein
MNVNGKAYKVYPDLRSLIFNIKAYDNKEELVQLNEMNTTMAICRQVVLTEFMDDFLNQLKKEQGNDLTQAQVEKCL